VSGIGQGPDAAAGTHLVGPEVEVNQSLDLG
jgi:hypothetical protein